MAISAAIQTPFWYAGYNLIVSETDPLLSALYSQLKSLPEFSTAEDC